MNPEPRFVTRDGKTYRFWPVVLPAVEPVSWDYEPAPGERVVMWEEDVDAKAIYIEPLIDPVWKP